jgi:N-acetylmuramoyl-L-alanine amidase
LRRSHVVSAFAALAAAILLGLFGPSAAPAGPAARVSAVRWDTKETQTRFVFEFTSAPRYRSQDDQVAEGYFYVDFYDLNAAGVSEQNERVDDQRVLSIHRRSFPKDGVVRFILRTDGVHPFVISTLDNPARVIVDVFERGGTPTDAQHQPARLAFEREEAARVPIQPVAPSASTSGKRIAAASYTAPPSFFRAPTSSAGKFVVTIDPGHGGRSIGAVSKAKFGGKSAHEKDLALGISQEVAKLVNADPSMRAVMLRTGDSYLTLEERVDMAERSGGDLFISIHLNSAPGSGSATGPEFYHLNDRGKGQLLNRIVRSMESNQKKSGGASAKKIVERMARQKVESLVRESRELCHRLEREFCSVSYYKTRNRGVKSANFYVLKNASAPSVLVEVGFMSDTSDVTRLRQEKYQREVARMIYQAIKKTATAQSK